VLLYHGSKTDKSVSLTNHILPEKKELPLDNYTTNLDNLKKSHHSLPYSLRSVLILDGHHLPFLHSHVLNIHPNHLDTVLLHESKRVLLLFFPVPIEPTVPHFLVLLH